ncbi:hypothetical protein AN189_17430 [Loktanella sp. 3ANDIMAR09]|uniref:hypothetical protein n=1 Tax=Loktanella sp. 3ANDIMAR09 TaxID=1225657 RepID=UPI0006F8489E|nr:hypothetical protein [Loktanella sp. 3ANDIMAR09]KQI67128.1 hypothetical protein AN189_17430 [Loktanella sp. 3ANDIMAR09]
MTGWACITRHWRAVVATCAVSVTACPAVGQSAVDLSVRDQFQQAFAALSQGDTATAQQGYANLMRTQDLGADLLDAAQRGLIAAQLMQLDRLVADTGPADAAVAALVNDILIQMAMPDSALTAPQRRAIAARLPDVSDAPVIARYRVRVAAASVRALPSSARDSTRVGRAPAGAVLDVVAVVPGREPGYDWARLAGGQGYVRTDLLVLLE